MQKTSLLLAACVIIPLALLSSHSSRASHPSRATVPPRKFDFTYTTRIGAAPAGAKILRVWVPIPRSDAYQDIAALKMTAPFTPARHREAEYGNQYYYFEIPAAKLTAPVELRMTFAAIRREHRVALVASADPAPPLTASVLTRFLQPDRLVPLDGVIGELADRETRGITGSLPETRAIYDYVVSTMHYDKSGTGWGRGDAVWACDSKRGNCTDFHSLFIGMERHAGIPAKFEIGFPLPETAHSGAIPGYHCWAEAYIQPFGWVPVDASEASQDPSKRDYFFGAHDVNRVQFTTGRDILLDPPQAGPPLNYFIYPYAELDGKPFDLAHEFFFRDVMPEAAPHTASSR